MQTSVTSATKNILNSNPTFANLPQWIQGNLIDKLRRNSVKEIVKVKHVFYSNGGNLERAKATLICDIENIGEMLCTFTYEYFCSPTLSDSYCKSDFEFCRNPEEEAPKKKKDLIQAVKQAHRILSLGNDIGNILEFQAAKLVRPKSNTTARIAYFNKKEDLERRAATARNRGRKVFASVMDYNGRYFQSKDIHTINGVRYVGTAAIILAAYQD